MYIYISLYHLHLRKVLGLSPPTNTEQHLCFYQQGSGTQLPAGNSEATVAAEHRKPQLCRNVTPCKAWHTESPVPLKNAAPPCRFPSQNSWWIWAEQDLIHPKLSLNPAPQKSPSENQTLKRWDKSGINPPAAVGTLCGVTSTQVMAQPAALLSKSSHLKSKLFFKNISWPL